MGQNFTNNTTTPSAEYNYNDKLSANYFKIWDTYPIQKYMSLSESAFLCKHISPGSKVVLLGSGGGREIPALLEMNCQITAIDLSVKMLEAGKQRYPDANIQWIQADLLDLPEDIGVFDAAVSFGAVFNYLLDPACVLRHVRKHLRQDGLVLMDVINRTHPSERKGSAKLSDGRIRYLYELAELSDLLLSTGFKVKDVCGLRYLVDLLPATWNRGEREYQEQTALLERLLREEELLTQWLPPEQAKFIVLAAQVSPAEDSNANQ